MNRDMRMGNLMGVILLATILLSACAAPSASTPALAPAATPIPTLAPTATPVPTATPAPTATRVPATSAPTPTAGPTLLSKPPELILAINKPPRQTSYLAHVVYTLPEMDKVLLASELVYYNGLTVDIYYPPNYGFKAKLPFVILVHGLEEKTEFDKDMVSQMDWAKLIAASGMIAVSAQSGAAPNPASYRALEFLAANADVLGLDLTRIGFWTASSQGAPMFLMLRDKELPYRDGFRAGVFAYQHLTTDPSDWPPKFSLFVIKAGKDAYVSGSAMDKFVARARSIGLPTEYVEVADAPHGFDTIKNTQAAKDAIRHALEFFKAKLLK